MSVRRLPVVAGLVLLVPACGGGDGGVTPPPNPTVNSIVITAPAAGPTFGALGRTVQFAAEARDAGGAVVGGVTITWASSNTAAATVSGTGLVTAAGNGTTTITASGGGKTSTGVTVTVNQVAVQGLLTPSNSTIGALGSTRQMAVEVRDSTGNALPGTPAVTWAVTNRGTVSVSGTGLVTALAVSTPGQSDTVLATVTGTGIVAATAIIVTQVPHSIVVGVPAGDSVLRTTGRTRQFTATVRDSNANALTAQPTITWTSNAAGVANVNGSGLVVAVGDGSATIQAAVGAVTATRTQVVQRYAATFTIAPPSATITTNVGTQGFTGTVQDTNGVNLPTTWLSRATGIATVDPSAGLTTTATAAGNGSTYIVMSGGMRVDSAALTVSGQTAPVSVSVNVGDIFFRSVGNNTQDPAVDTVAVGGTVTWTWVGSLPHSVQSTGSPSFTSSPTQAAGNYQRVFNAAGTYTYDCVVHGAQMTGTIVVR